MERTKINKTILISLLVLGFTVLIGLALLVQTIPSVAQASTPDVSGVTDDQVNVIARQLYCPVCENIPLDVCGTQACAQWRELIRQMLAEGKTEQEIKDYFVNQYGARVLATPPARGLNWLFYLVPPVAILLGAFLLYRALRGLRKPVEPVPDQPPAATDEYMQRLEEELKKR